jgi:hypothetical protein
VSPPGPHPLAAVVGGWVVAARPGRVWLHPVSLVADGDLTPDAAEALAAALVLTTEDARRPHDSP